MAAASEDWRGQPSPSIVVRNTFIDVCPMEDDSNSDNSSPCRSPHRRNNSAPPSPARKRSSLQGEAYSDEEEEEDPGSIPNYQVADSGQLVSIESEAPGVGVLSNYMLEGKQWLRTPPGSPKKVASKRKSNKKDMLPLQGRPPLGSYLRNSANSFLDSSYDAGYSLHQDLGPALGSADYTVPLPPAGQRGIGTGLGLHQSFGDHDLGFGVGRGLGVGLEQRESQESLQAPKGGGAAYISESPPANPALGGAISTEAPVYILNAACSSSSPSQPQHSTVSAAIPEAGRRRGRDLEASQRALPVQDAGKGGGWPTFFQDTAGMQGQQPFQIAQGFGGYSDLGLPGYVPPSGDAGDRRPEGLYQHMVGGGNGLPTGAQEGRHQRGGARGGKGALANGGPPFIDPYGGPAYGAIPLHPGDRKGQPSGVFAPAVVGRGNAQLSGGQDGRKERGSRGGRGSGKGGGRGAEAVEIFAQEAGPWIAPGAQTGGFIQGKSGGRGEKKKADDSSQGEVKGPKVPLSGGGPKRTDYIKKYGTGTAEEGIPAPANNTSAGGKLPITTMMLKNIPCRKSQEEVMAHIDQNGFEDRYDFFYLPRDVKFRANLGYAFINFLTPEDAARFEAEMNGYRFTGSGSNKACMVVPAHVQGLMNNLSAFKRTEVMRSSRKPYFSGVVTL